jgi:predicted TIM-barrel fold metal-dependent hydrolase
MIVEWNTHLFAADTDRYPFHPNAAYVPGPDRRLDDPLAAYLQSMEDRGIDRAVVVHPEPYGDDHRLILDSLDREAERIKGTCLFYPRDPQAVSKLGALVARRPRIIATRFHAHRGTTHYLDSFDDERVRSLWVKGGELGLVIELHIGPSYAAQVGRTIAAYPSFPVLIDHMCEPQFGRGDEYEDVIALSRFPNVTMKMSGLDHFSQEPEPHRDVQPLVRRVAEAFGPDHLAWSKGSPEIVDRLLDHWSEADRAKVKGLNLAALAGFHA